LEWNGAMKAAWVAASVISAGMVACLLAMLLRPDENAIEVRAASGAQERTAAAREINGAAPRPLAGEQVTYDASLSTGRRLPVSESVLGSRSESLTDKSGEWRKRAAASMAPPAAAGPVPSPGAQMTREVFAEDVVARRLASGLRAKSLPENEDRRD